MPFDFLAFLENYTEENSILLPGRIPIYKQDDIRLLLSNPSKVVRYLNMYIKIAHTKNLGVFECCKSANAQVVAKTSYIGY